MAGAFVGVLAAAALLGRITRRGWLSTLGAAMPALLLAAALGRFAECLTTEGIGDYVDNPFWQFFPFAVPDVYGDLRFPVFVWEGLTALVICAVAWRCLRRPQDAALTGMLLFALTQVFWESLRRDGFLRFGFVRVNQLWCAVMLAAVTALWLLRARPSRAVVAGSALGLAAGIGALVALEFAFDKSPVDNRILYAVMAAVLAAMGAGLLTLRRRARGKEAAHA